MLKWTGNNNGRPIIGLGLEERNLERLRLNEPILVHGKDIGVAFDILIYYGKDIATLITQVQSGIGPDTIIYKDKQNA